ncbi:MAG: MFS transporter, partial [Phycisphaerales bacterium]|nr:MFS transporter [Phycisphaerales bacterium]
AAIVVDSFPPNQRGRAMATYAGISLLFLAAGPLIGGALVQYASWEWCFWLNVPVACGAVALTIALRLNVPRGAPRTTDGWSAIALVGGIPLLIVGLQDIGLRGWNDGDAWLPATCGVALVTFFCLRQVRLSQPLIDLRLLADRGLFGDALVLFFLQAINVGQAIYGSMYLQTVLGFTPLQAGIASLPLLAPVLIVVHFAGRLYDRRGPRPPLLVGLCFVCAGTIVQTIGVHLLNYPIMATGMTLLGIGCGMAMSPANADALGRVSPQQRGEASGIVQTMRQMGSTLGIAAMVMVMHRATQEQDLSPRAYTLGFSLHIALAITALLCAWRFVSPRADHVNCADGAHHGPSVRT